MKCFVQGCLLVIVHRLLMTDPTTKTKQIMYLCVKHSKSSSFISGLEKGYWEYTQLTIQIIGVEI